MSVLDSTPLATRAAAWRISSSVPAEPSRKVSTAVARKGRDANPVTPTRARLILLLALRGQAAACLLSRTSYRREGMRDLAFRPECVFRGKLSTDSGRSCPPIPEEVVQGFRRDVVHFFT